MSGIYIHIPFCKTKCLYCDFYTGGSRIADWRGYISNILNELRRRQGEITTPLNTLYIGGGTPSLIPVQEFKRLIDGLYEITGKHDWSEFTMEVNPEDVNDETLDAWKDFGVTRASIGLQTLKDKELKAIGRRHDSVSGQKALLSLMEKFKNVSVDLMYGIPLQTVATYAETLNKILEIRPSHISVYSLMLEPGTPMTLLSSQGKLVLPDENTWLEMSEYTEQALNSKGYKRYEISNYAVPGYESLHNKAYWDGKPYLGLGPGAHSYDGEKIRRANPNDIKGYMDYFRDSISANNSEPVHPFYTEERLTDEELREEILLTRLRTVKGLNLKEYEDKFGSIHKQTLLKKARNYIKSGLLKEEKGNLSFTTKGFLVSDSIISSIV